MRALFYLLAFVMTSEIFSVPVQAAPVTDALRTELKLLAEDVAKIVEKKGGGGIAIGEFSGSIDVVGHSRPGIQLILAEELRAAKLTVDNQNHRFEISGRYQPFHDTAENREKSGGQPADATNQIEGTLGFPNLGGNDSIVITLHGHGKRYNFMGFRVLRSSVLTVK